MLAETGNWLKAYQPSITIANRDQWGSGSGVGSPVGIASPSFWTKIRVGDRPSVQTPRMWFSPV